MINRFMKRSRVLLLLYHDFYNLNNIIRCITMLSHNGKTQAERMDPPGTQSSQPQLKWRLASLALAVGIIGTALAAHVAGFNLATSAAALFPQGTWLSSAFTAVGTLENAGASAAMVAGGLLSVAVIRLSAVLLKAAFSFIYDKIEARFPSTGAENAPLRQVRQSRTVVRRKPKRVVQADGAHEDAGPSAAALSHTVSTDTDASDLFVSAASSINSEASFIQIASDSSEASSLDPESDYNDNQESDLSNAAVLQHTPSVSGNDKQVVHSADDQATAHTQQEVVTPTQNPERAVQADQTLSGGVMLSAQPAIAIQEQAALKVQSCFRGFIVRQDAVHAKAAHSDAALIDTADDAHGLTNSGAGNDAQEQANPHTTTAAALSLTGTAAGAHEDAGPSAAALSHTVSTDTDASDLFVSADSSIGSGDPADLDAASEQVAGAHPAELSPEEGLKLILRW